MRSESFRLFFIERYINDLPKATNLLRVTSEFSLERTKSFSSSLKHMFSFLSFPSVADARGKNPPQL